MPPRKIATPPKPVTKRTAPRSPVSRPKKAPAAPKSAPKAARSKPVRKRAAKPSPPIVPPAPIGVLQAVEAFIASSEITGQARVKAEIARTLARALDDADPPTAPALARELQAALIGILPKDTEQHDDWTTRLGSSTSGNAKGS